MNAFIFANLIMLIVVGAAICIIRPPKIAPIRGRRHIAVLLSFGALSLALAMSIVLAPASGDLSVAAALGPCMAGLVITLAYVFARKGIQRLNQSRQKSLWASQGRSAVAVMQAELQAGYPFILHSPSTGEESLLCMTVDGSTLRFLRIAGAEEGVQRKADVTVAIADVVSVELVKHEQVLTQSTTLTQKKGVIGRSVVGEMLFGPTGALVGAVSAGSRSTTTGVERRVYQYSELVFGLADLTNPVIRFLHTDHAEADRWLHRIRSAMHRHRSSPASAGPGPALVGAPTV